MSLVAPNHLSHIVIDNVEYTPDENGNFRIDHPDHVRTAKRHGFLDPSEYAIGKVSPIPDDFGNDDIFEKAAALADENADLKARIAALEAAAAPGATDTPATGTDSSGDTSGQDVDTTGDDQQDDPLAAALAENPNFDEMSRDDMVAWLAKVGTPVPGNVSTQDARKAIDALVASTKG